MNRIFLAIDYKFKEKASLNYKECPKCKSTHYQSYAIQKNTKAKVFFTYDSEVEYFHSSSESIFETKLLFNLLSDIVFCHTSFKGFASSYNYRYAIQTFKRNTLDYRRLIEAFFALQLNRYYGRYKPNEKITSYLLI